MSSTLEAPPETTDASNFLNALVIPVDTPSTSPGSLIWMVIEFKTPITAIRGAVEVLEDHAGDMTLEERNKFTGNVRSDVARLERLTNGLLELTSVEMSVANDEFCVLIEHPQRSASPASFSVVVV